MLISMKTEHKENDRRRMTIGRQMEHIILLFNRYFTSLVSCFCIYTTFFAALYWIMEFTSRITNAVTSITSAMDVADV